MKNTPEVRGLGDVCVLVGVTAGKRELGKQSPAPPEPPGRDHLGASEKNSQKGPSHLSAFA